jgi:hypothetical protein
MVNHLFVLALRIRMLLLYFVSWKPLLRATHSPDVAQERLLLRILALHKNTEFGKKHDFSGVRTLADYQRQVPVQEYESLRPWVERQETTGEPCLTHEAPVFFTVTSGTTAQPKYLPITRRALKNYKSGQNLAAFAIHMAYPKAYRGKLLAISGAAIEGWRHHGLPYGSMSGLLRRSMPALLRQQYAVPADVFEIDDYEEKYFLICQHAMAARDITLVATANPSTLLRLDKIMNQRADELLELLAKVQPQRAAELQRIRDKNARLKFADLWPELQVVSVWTGGNCALLLPKLCELIPEHTRLVDLGYLSSEFRGGIVVDARENLEIPALLHNFYEFVERDSWEINQPRFLSLNQLETGRQYYVFVTTWSGLYRYAINDLLEVTGSFNATPTIRFVQKGKGVTSLTGEKLYEQHVLEAVQRFSLAHDVTITFFMLLGDPHTFTYTLHIEHAPVANDQLESYLCDINTEFADKLMSGRLQSLQVNWLSEGAGEAYKLHCLGKGQREGQYKLVHLQYLQDCTFDFGSVTRGDTDAVA